MEKRKKDGCETSRNRQKKETGKRNRIVLLAGAGIVAAALLTGGLMHGCREKIPTMQEVFEAYLEGEDNGLEMLSGLGESEKEKVIDTAIRMLEGLFGDGSSFDRESAVKALEQAILELNLGLSGEEIHQLAEALTDLYVNAYQEVYTSEQKTQTTVKHLESSVTAQMEENLSSVSEHLTQLDLQIQDNQNTLEQVFSQGESLGTSVENLKEKTELIREQVSESMKEIGEGLSRVDQAVGQTQEKLEQYHAAHEETIRESSKELQKQISGVREQLADAQETLSDTLKEMAQKGQLHQEELLKQFQELDDAVKKTQEQLTEIGESGQKALAELGTDLKGEMADKKSELEGILEELEKNLQGTAKENMEYIESRFSSMELLTKASLEELSENINLSAAGLQERLSEIHVQISDTKEQIGAALKTMDQKQEENCQELMHAIEEATKKIDGELEAAYLQLEVLITQLSADTEADHAETLKVLDGMRASLGTSMQQNLDQLNASFSSLNSALEVYFEKLQEAQGAGQDAIGELGIDLKGNQQIILDSISAHGAKVQEGHSGIKESITQHNASMNAGLEGVGNAVGAYQTSMQEFLTQLKTELNDQLKSVFTFVSNGKQGLVSGGYKLLLEPVGYYRFQGSMIATTATEAALYDEKLSGGLRKRMVSFTHKNLPLSMFLETGDLGYPAWGKSTDQTVSDEEIKSSLGLGIVRFQDILPEGPEVASYDYEYRTNTEVITSVRIKGGQSDPEHPVTVTFQIGGRDYRVENVYYPEGEEQLAWVRWTTPKEEQVMEIPVTVEGGGTAEKGIITARITELGKNPPPDPNADDRNDSFQAVQIPYRSEATTTGWSVWKPWWKAEWVWHETPEAEEEGYWVDEGWWEFLLERHSASLSASMELWGDEKSPTANGKTMKSGYGFHERVMTSVQTDQPDAVTPAQNAVTYFPEFGYKTFWRLLERMGDGYGMTHEFFENSYSTYRGRTHFTPIWYPDGSYTPYTWLMDCWTPAGMLARNLTDTLQIQGNLWEDWHIAPQNPWR